MDSNELFGIEAILQVLNRLPQDVLSVSRVDHNILVGCLNPKDSIYRNHNNAFIPEDSTLRWVLFCREAQVLWRQALVLRAQLAELVQMTRCCSHTCARERFTTVCGILLGDFNEEPRPTAGVFFGGKLTPRL